MARSSTRKKTVVNYNENESEVSNFGAIPKERKKQAVTKVEVAAADTEQAAETSKTGKQAANGTKKRKEKPEDDTQQARAETPKPKKSRATKAGKEDAMPIAERTAVSSLGKAVHIGAHVSAAGGVQNAVTNAVHIGANAFALFLKSQRKWDNPPLAAEARDGFIAGCSNHGYAAKEHVLPHGSYLVNLAQADAQKAEQAFTAFVDDLKRCDELGIKLYNFHPGSTGGELRQDAIGRIATQLNKSHQATKSVITVLENMAGAGNVIGSTWEDLRDVIALVEDKDRVGVCIDTCHAFAAGHDLRTPSAFEATMDRFNSIVGEKYLKAFHLNDSKAPFESHRDLHANIGTGFLGLRAFHTLVNRDSFRGLPMVLETPIDKKDANGKAVEDKQIWADEIKLLESLIGMDPDGKEFQRLQEELAFKGDAERGKMQDQIDKKAPKSAKKESNGKVGKVK